jgi:hypothetical protein
MALIGLGSRGPRMNATSPALHCSGFNNARSMFRIKRKTQLNSAEAAAAAARADALARSSKLKSSARSREAARLAAENKALLEVLTTVADGNPEIQAKLQAIRQRYPAGSQVGAGHITTGIGPC